MNFLNVKNIIYIGIITILIWLGISTTSPRVWIPIIVLTYLFGWIYLLMWFGCSGCINDSFKDLSSEEKEKRIKWMAIKLTIYHFIPFIYLSFGAYDDICVASFLFYFFGHGAFLLHWWQRYKKYAYIRPNWYYE